MNEFLLHLETIFEDIPSKIVISKPPKSSEYRRVCLLKKESGYQLEKYTEKQVFHENLSAENALKRCADFLSEGFCQLNAWGESREFGIAVSKKGKVLFTKKQLTE